MNEKASVLFFIFFVKSFLSFCSNSSISLYGEGVAAYVYTPSADESPNALTTALNPALSLSKKKRKFFVSLESFSICSFVIPVPSGATMFLIPA